MSTATISSGLHGTLATVPFPDLLQLLSGGRKTGTLTLRNSEHVKRIFFKDGEIISSSSDDPAEFLGQFLLFQGRISEDQLRKALEVQGRTGVMIGKILVMAGALTEEEVAATLARKAEETIFSLFLWEQGTFHFEDGALPAQPMIPISLRIQDILLEGVKAVDDLKRIRQEFRSPRPILRRTTRAAPPAALADHLAGKIYARLDGRLSLPDLCLEFRCSELAASSALFRLYQGGYVEVAGAAAGVAVGAKVSAQALVDEAEELVHQGQLEAAIDLYRKALSLSPATAGLREKLERCETLFVEKAHKHLLPLHRVPVLRVKPESLLNENLSPQEGFLLTRINGVWDLKSIISISPIKEVDALRCMDRLRRRGIIELMEPAPRPGADPPSPPEPPPPVKD